MGSPHNVGTPEIDAVPHIPRIGGMATMPGRVDTFRQARDSILPQVDRLFIFFDKYEAVPADLVNDCKIVPLLPSTHGDLAGRGKFLGLEMHPEHCFYYSVDDDILYPPNYVEVLTRALYRHKLEALVGFQAQWFGPPHLSYLKDRAYLPFYNLAKFDCHADEIGTGTMAFDSAHLRFDPRSWRHSNMEDLNVAIEAAKRGIPRITIRRTQGFLRPLAENQDDSSYMRLFRDDSRQTALMREAIATYPQSWHLWENV